MVCETDLGSQEKFASDRDCVLDTASTKRPRFPKRQILDCSKLKEFADDIIKFDENDIKFAKLSENTVGKGEIASSRSVFKRHALQTQGLFGIGFEHWNSRKCFCNHSLFFIIKQRHHHSFRPAYYHLTLERIVLTYWSPFRYYSQAWLISK